MLGRSANQDRGVPVLDPRSLMGADVRYGRQLGTAASEYRRAPQYLNASNKPSEHNISNIPVRIVVVPLSGQPASRQTRRTISRPIRLPGGNQSLGGT